MVPVLTVSPDVLALQRQRGTVAVEAISGVLAAGAAVLLEHVGGTLARLPGAQFGQVALVRRVPTHHASFFEAAVLAARPRGALRLLGQLAGDGVAAGIDFVAVVDAAAVAVLALLHHAVTARPVGLEGVLWLREH